MKNDGFIDLNDGYYYPYLKTRVIPTLHHINFSAAWLYTPMAKLQERLTRMLSRKHKYYMMATQESEVEEEELETVAKEPVKKSGN